MPNLDALQELLVPTTAKHCARSMDSAGRRLRVTSNTKALDAMIRVPAGSSLSATIPLPGEDKFNSDKLDQFDVDKFDSFDSHFQLESGVLRESGAPPPCGLRSHVRQEIQSS